LAEVFEVTDEVKAQFGVEGPPWTYEATTTSIRMYARGIGSTDPLHYDVDYAKSQGFRSIVAPMGYVGTPVFHPDTNDGTFGFPRRAGGGPRLNLPTKGLLDGGTETEYLDYICAGDTLTETSHLEDVKVRGNMVFVTNVSQYKNQEGKVVAKQRLTSIHIG
jgi:acyl dehydratase